MPCQHFDSWLKGNAAATATLSGTANQAYLTYLYIAKYGRSLRLIIRSLRVVLVRLVSADPDTRAQPRAGKV